MSVVRIGTRASAQARTTHRHSQVVVGASTAATGLLPGLFAIDCWAVHAVVAVTRVEGVT